MLWKQRLGCSCAKTPSWRKPLQLWLRRSHTVSTATWWQTAQRCVIGLVGGGAWLAGWLAGWMAAVWLAGSCLVDHVVSLSFCLAT